MKNTYKSNPTDLFWLIEQYLDSDRIDRQNLIGSRMLQIKQAFDNNLYADFRSFKKLINRYKPYGFGYNQAIKYMKIASYPDLARKKAKEIGSYDLNKLCKELPSLQGIE